MTRKLAILKASAAAAALAFVLPAPAHAFDDVDWDWEKNIVEDWDIDIVIDETFVIDDMVQIEKLQWFIGDLNAYAKVDNIHNEPFQPVEDENGVVVIDETFNFSGTADDDVDPTAFPETAGTGGDQLDATLLDTTFLDEGSDEFSVDVNVTGEIELDPETLGALDAADLPKVENIAVAVANNQIIESSSPLFLHDGQFVTGEGTDGGPEQFSFEFVENNDNLHTQLALDLADEAYDGDISPATISAEAYVGEEGCGENCLGGLADVLNAYVENSATAVANNASYTVFADGIDGSGNTMVADLTQFAYADVDARAEVYDVLIDGYAGFGEAGFGGVCGNDCVDGIVPIVSNVATAVGNNLNISVGVEPFDTE